MAGTIWPVFVVVRSEPAFALIPRVVFLVSGAVLKSPVVSIFITVGHAGHIAFAIICFSSNGDFMDSVFFHGFDDNVPIFPAGDKHGIVLLGDDMLQFLRNKNSNAKLYLHGNHPFIFYSLS